MGERHFPDHHRKPACFRERRSRSEPVHFVLSVRYSKRFIGVGRASRGTDAPPREGISVMRHHTRLVVSSLAALALFSASVNAHAQDTYYPPPTSAPPTSPPPQTGPPPPADAVAPNGQYVAPLAQNTQQIYIPQSVAMSGPREIKDWDETQPIPPGYHASSHIRTGMVVGGAVLFASLWLISVLTASIWSDSNPGVSNGDASLYVPVAGPFLQWAGEGQGSTATGNVFLAIDGIGQAAGVAMFIYGLASPRTMLVRNDLANTKPMILPVRMGQDGYGAAFIAHF